MTLVYVRWRDACHSMRHHELATIGELAELHEVGFLLKETADAITIGSEAEDAGTTEARMWLTIPRNAIVEERRTTLAKAFPKPRKRREVVNTGENAATKHGTPEHRNNDLQPGN